MSIQMNTTAPVAPSYSSLDALHRHEHGVQKHRKLSSTGGGRAWSEDEEGYLLQTRMQKMPYKHIAAHLKKTELACRLHYHQLSHGSNRRKRTNSITSSSAGSVTQSPVMTSMPSPIPEGARLGSHTPPMYSYTPEPPAHVQLPSASALLSRATTGSPSAASIHPVAILPKPVLPRRALADSPLGPALRLDCEMATSPISPSAVNKERLQQIYEAHRASFWSVIASEYGNGVSPGLLEETWKRGIATNAPPTPCVSPDANALSAGGYQAAAPPSKNNAASISSLLGIDASPRSPQERELIKRMEEGREGMGCVEVA